MAEEGEYDWKDKKKSSISYIKINIGDLELKVCVLTIVKQSVVPRVAAAIMRS